MTHGGYCREGVAKVADVGLMRAQASLALLCLWTDSQRLTSVSAQAGTGPSGPCLSGPAAASSC